MRNTVSIKKNHEFRKLYSKGKSAVSPVMALYCRKTGRECNRLGLTVGIKVGKAVQRNRVRRRLREIYRLHEDELGKGWDLVVVARVKAAHSRYQTLERSFLELAGRLGVRKQERSE